MDLRQRMPGAPACCKRVWIVLLMTPERHRKVALYVGARRQFLARANDRGAGTNEVLGDLELGGQLTPPLLSNRGAADLRHDRGRGEGNYNIASVVQHPGALGRDSVTLADLLSRLHSKPVPYWNRV